MFRDTQQSPWEQFLAHHPALSDFLDQVRVESAGLPSLATPEDFAAELKTIQPGAGIAPGLGKPAAHRMAVMCRAVESALGKTPWDHQIVCATLLLQGFIVELPNGSGKTIAAFLAAGFNCTSGRRTHIVTANDYLAERDLRELGPAYHLLGIDIGIGYSKQTADLDHGVWEAGDIIRAKPAFDWPPGQSDQPPATAAVAAETVADDDSGNDPSAVPLAGPAAEEAPAPSMTGELRHRPLAGLQLDPELSVKEVFERKVVYGRIEFFAFTFLRDNTRYDASEQALTQRDLLIVDECDSVMLDDLRLPIILTEESYDSPEPHLTTQTLVSSQQLALLLVCGVDFVVRGMAVTFTFAGVRRVAELAGADLFTAGCAGLPLAVMNALKANFAYRSGVDYLVQDGRIVLIEQESGRLLIGRRYSNGLHEALEIKEGLAVSEQAARQQAVGRITIKHFARLYLAVAGMSGTIGPPAEYQRFYGLQCATIGLERLTRHDDPDMIFRTSAEAVQAAVDNAFTHAAKGRPVLLNVPTIEQVDDVVEVVRQRAARGAVPAVQALDGRSVTSLGAEAEEVALAGRAGQITICSKVAARGTDIKLDPAAIGNGGLHVIGLQRAEDRRYDDQLRGRAGRHGEPGSSVFILSLQDELMARFGGPAMQNFLRRLGLEEGESIEGGFITSRIRAAQKAQRAQALASRVNVVEFDDVVARHRLVFYSLRQRLLVKEGLAEDLTVAVDNCVELVRRNLLPSRRSAFGAPRASRDFLGRLADCFDDHEVNLILTARGRKSQSEVLRRALTAKIERVLSQVTPEAEMADNVIRQILLSVLDSEWKKYHRFEDDALDEVNLYSWDDPAAFERYARKMEAKFDSFFFDVGEELLHYLLLMRRAE